MEDREKLNKVAEERASQKYEYNTVGFRRCVNDIKFGADWLMQQPLSERLTAEEKEKINKLQGEILKEIMDAHDADDWQSVAHYILDVMPRSFVSVFGMELFNEEKE